MELPRVNIAAQNVSSQPQELRGSVERENLAAAKSALSGDSVSISSAAMARLQASEDIQQPAAVPRESGQVDQQKERDQNAQQVQAQEYQAASGPSSAMGGINQLA